jgi:uncharacterized protein YbjT (DUF2867 family)
VPLRSCVVLGATGLVGGHVVRAALRDPAYGSVVTLGRRPLGVADAKLVEHIVDFEAPETYRAHLGVDDVFCCLGTTIKKAGSQAAFRRVDLAYPLAIAEEALKAGAKQWLLVTAVSASASSSVFYNRVKGELEERTVALDFPNGVKIFRPSMLLGERGESRPAEAVGKAILKVTRGLFVGGLARYKAIEGEQVAAAMLQAAKSEPAGNATYEAARMFELAERSSP